jgi:predicted PurR-regulated permease PerM
MHRAGANPSVRQSVLTAAMLVVAWLAWMLRDLVMLVGFAALLAYALDPIVSLVQRIPLPGGRAVPRGTASGVVILTLALIAGLSLAAAVPRLTRDIAGFAEGAPGAIARLEQEVRRLAESHGWGGLLGTDSVSGRTASLFLHAVQQWSMRLLGSAFGNLGQAVGLLLLPVLAFYLLAEREAVRSSALNFIPEDLRPQVVRVLNAIDPALRAYVRGQSLVCLLMGSSMALVLGLLGYPLVLLLGVAVGLAEVIPFLGFWIAATAIALEGYTRSPGSALAGLGAYVIVNNLMGYFITPRLLAREVKMHPFYVTVSVLGGGALLGPPGVILALPAAAMLQAVIGEFAPSRERAT